METIRVDVTQDAKIIEVNDNGDTVTLNLGDIAFTSRLLSLIQDFREAAEKISGKVTEISGDNQEKLVRLMELADFNLNVCNTLKQRVDDVLGPDTCKKVFGDSVPGILDFTDFFGQLMGIVNRYTGEQAEKQRARISKYTAKYKDGGRPVNG